MAQSQQSHLYRILGFYFSTFQPAAYEYRTTDPNWMKQVRDICSTNADFQFAGVLLDRTPAHRSDSLAPVQSREPREFTVIGFDLATRRTTIHQVLARNARSAAEAVQKRWRNSFHHIICGAYDGDVELMLTLIGYLDANQPVTRLLADMPAAENEVEKREPTLMRMHA